MSATDLSAAWALIPGDPQERCFGPVTHAERHRLLDRLRFADRPGEVDPEVPWAAGVRRANGDILLAASTMWGAGVFWSLRPEGLIWGTDLGALVTERGHTPLDDEWIADCLRGRGDGDSTPYEGVRRLPPGCSILIDRTGRVGPLINWATQGWPEVGDLAGDAAVHAFRDAFAQSLQRLAQRSGPITVSLSGGLDSTYLAAILAQAGAEVLGCVASPLAGAALLKADGRIPDDLPWARLLAQSYPEAITIERVSNDDLVAPLDAAAQASSRSWWPCLSATNMVWMRRVRQIALARGSSALFVGSHGNWSFSPEFARPRIPQSRVQRIRRRVTSAYQRPATRDSPVRLRTRRDDAVPRAAAPRATYLRGLARRGRTFAPLDSPAANGLWIADPFSSAQVLNVAARITTAQWQTEPSPRGFARQVAFGAVPDPIRLRTARGAQAPDAWAWIKDHRARYESELDLATDTDIVNELVDVAHLRACVLGWSWGSDDAPQMVDLLAVHRVLALAGFVRQTRQRLASLNAATSLEGDRSCDAFFPAWRRH